jgi:pyruvate formate-lyase activating enzyme-like uncharacterized protein
MDPYLEYLNKLVNKNKAQFADYNGNLNWINSYDAIEKENRRKEILDNINKSLKWSFKGTKPWINRLSIGCELCGAGDWSCIFITGKCNANCFYCPAQQDKDEIPSTQQLNFEKPADYADYINYFGYKGIGLSGGEPLYVPERSLEFIKEIRKKCDPDIYIWLYTNGTLGDTELFKRLADAGIEEVRFDIGATNYSVSAIRNVKGIIPNITIEIPSIPEETERLKKLLPLIIDAGVTNLNLHQLRLTEYNAPKVLKRNYTYLHGERVTVLESEITALEIIQYIAQRGLDIGVNYCSFQYKNRFQKAGYRRKIASQFLKPGEELTESGYLRSIRDSNGNSIVFSELLRSINDLPETLVISYRGVLPENHIENNSNWESGRKEYAVMDRMIDKAFELNKTDFIRLTDILSGDGSLIPDDPMLFAMWKHEFIESGLRNYF